jgi:hypothetical protein
MEEEWRDVDGYAGAYSVSSRGNVRINVTRFPCHAGDLLRQRKGYRGSRVVLLAQKGAQVHGLVARAFIPDYDSRNSVVEHLNGDRSDNRLENLRVVPRTQGKGEGRVEPIALPGEVWRTVPLPLYGMAYAISSFGRAWKTAASLTHPAGELRPQKVNGYRGFIMKAQGQKKAVTVHRMVALAFLGEPPSPRYVVNHKDGNRTNNRVENLEWMTSRGNALHALCELKTLRGGRFISPEQAQRIRERYAAGELQKDLAREYEVHQQQVSLLIRGKGWQVEGESPVLPAVCAGVENPGPELWRTPLSRPRVEVSTWGRVRRRKDGKILKPSPNKGYYTIPLSDRDGATRTTRVHRLVAECFLPPPPAAGTVVHHRNENRADNRVTNLEWASLSENQRYRRAEEHARERD